MTASTSAPSPTGATGPTVPAEDGQAAHTGPVSPTATSTLAFVPGTAAHITGGFWAERRRINTEVAIPSAAERLEQAGNFTNLAVVAGLAEREPVDSVWFFDTDVYKWLEAIGWSLQHDQLEVDQRAELLRRAEAAVTLLEEAQAEDGYLQTYYQLLHPGMRFAELQWGHELYNAGHLIQGAIAMHRGSGDARLLGVARRFADLVVASFGTGEGQIDGICGHPEIESALVELYRETGETSYLRTAGWFVDRRGHGLLGTDQFGSQYWQDRVPVREATGVEGHAVRQLYLLAAMADLAAETGEAELRAAAERLWQDMVSTRTYITGGVGTHHRDEAFGDPYELTNERSYGETCAAIASVMFSWRMLLLTGEAKYADLIERTLYNGFLAGLSLDGCSYVYANPLQIREGHVHQGNQHDYERQPWFSSACCPPNVMRTLASLGHYAAVGSAAGAPAEVRLHQYIAGRFTVGTDAGPVSVQVATDYPWDGAIKVVLLEVPSTPALEWTLTLRVPQWASGHRVRVNGAEVAATVTDGWLRILRTWAVGDQVQLDLPLEPRFTQADPRVDADRGLVALERGPLVYCLEAVDNPGIRLDDVIVEASAAAVTTASASSQQGPAAELGEVLTLQLPARVAADRPAQWWPYSTTGAEHSDGTSNSASLHQASTGQVNVVAVPYYLWGNRGSGALRVWLRTI